LQKYLFPPSKEATTMKIGDWVVANRKIEMSGGKVFAAHTKGIVVETPPDKGVLHVRFNGENETYLVTTKNVRPEGEPPPKLLQHIWHWLTS